MSRDDSPYAPPAGTVEAATPREDRTDPRFRIIPVTSPRRFVLSGIVAVVLLAAMVHVYLTHSFLISLVPLVVSEIISPVFRWDRHVRNARAIRHHPLVLDGQALYAGSVFWGTRFRSPVGFLFLTRGDLVFFQDSGDREAVESTRQPLRDIQSVAVRRRFGLFPCYLEIYRRSGILTTYTATQARLWKEAIDQVLAEKTSGVAASPVTTP